MKEIRLEIPLECWKNLSSGRIWLKCVEDHTEAYEDRWFEWPIPLQKSISMYIAVPKELSSIEVLESNELAPIDQANTKCYLDQPKPYFKERSLKKVQILSENLNAEIPVIGERVNLDRLRKLLNKTGIHNLKWILIAKTFEDRTIGKFYWHPDLAKEMLDKVQNIYFSKGKEIPCVWEKGGHRGDIGKSTIVCGSKGGLKSALYVVKQSGNALIPVTEGSVIIHTNCNYKIGELRIKLLQIEEIKAQYREAKVRLIASFYDGYGMPYREADIVSLRGYIDGFCYGYWYNEEVAKEYKNAILAGFKRATSKGTKEPYFAKTMINNR